MHLVLPAGPQTHQPLIFPTLKRIVLSQANKKRKAFTPLFWFGPVLDAEPSMGR